MENFAIVVLFIIVKAFYKKETNAFEKEDELRV